MPASKQVSIVAARIAAADHIQLDSPPDIEAHAGTNLVQRKQ